MGNVKKYHGIIRNGYWKYNDWNLNINNDTITRRVKSFMFDRETEQDIIDLELFLEDYQKYMTGTSNHNLFIHHYGKK